MANELNIRPLLAEHLAELQMLEQACFAGAWSERQLLRQLEHPRGFNRGLWLGEHLVGFALFSTLLDEAELLQIGVDPQHQGAGLAVNLLSVCHAQLADKAVSILHLEVRQSNQAAICVYQKLGYQHVGERPAYYPPLPGHTSREAAVLFSAHNPAV